MQSACRSICQDGSILMIGRCRDISSAHMEKHLKQIITARETPLSQHHGHTEEQWAKRESKMESGYQRFSISSWEPGYLTAWRRAGTARWFASSSDVGREIKIALIKSAGSHHKCFGGQELNAALIASAARTGPESIGSD